MFHPRSDPDLSPVITEQIAELDDSMFAFFFNGHILHSIKPVQPYSFPKCPISLKKFVSKTINMHSSCRSVMRLI